MLIDLKYAEFRCPYNAADKPKSTVEVNELTLEKHKSIRFINNILNFSDTSLKNMLFHGTVHLDKCFVHEKSRLNEVLKCFRTLV